MGIYIEALILYILLFFSGVAVVFSGGTSGTTEFSAAAELSKILLYIIPSLVLIWYLILRAKTIEIWAIKFGKKDLISLALTLPALLITGSVVALAASFFNGTSAQTVFHTPSSLSGWIIVCISCVFSAYLEESYFRFYLLTKREALNLNAPSALCLSVVLFSLCHIGGGPWSFLNAAISGTFFGFMFLRYNSLHGIAIAHALYNIAAFSLNALNN
jgi:membrane protease YdiL (CAAX protease family)